MTQPIDTAYVEIKPESDGFTRNLKRDVDRAFSSISKDVDRHTSRIKSSLSSAFGAISGAIRAVGTVVLLVTKLVALAAAAGAVSAALAGLASAVGGGIQSLIGLVQVATQAAGALLLIPGALAILGSAVATLKIGFSGIGAAFKEAGSAAGGGSAQIEGAERRIMLAQREAKSAQEALTRARKDAQEQIEDLARSLNGARLDEEASVIALEDAQRALVVAQRSGDPDAIRRADLAYRQAAQSLEDVQDRVGDLAEEKEEADKKGVEGSDAVQAALQRQADAAFNLAEAQKAATASAGGMASAMSKLAPNAQAFVRALIALKPAFDQLRLSVQNALFANLGTEITKLATAQLPVLQRGLTDIAVEMNTGIIAAFRELSSAASRADFATIFESAARVIHNLSGAIAPLLHALRDIATVGSEVLADLTGGLSEWAKEFQKRISDMRASGELKKLITDGIAAIKQLFGLLVDVFGIIKGIAKAAGSSGGLFSFFDKLNKLVNSTQGQSALAKLFQELGRIGTALMPVLLAVVQALGPIAKGIGEIAVAFAPVLVTLVESLGRALVSLVPGFIALIPAVAVLARGLAPLAEILVGLVVAAGPGIAALMEGLVSGLTALAPVAPIVGRALGELFALLGPVLQILGAALAPLLAELALALADMAVVMTPVLQVFANIATTLVQKLLPPLLALAKDALPRYVELGAKVAKAFEPLIPLFAEMATIIADELIKHIPDLIAFFETLAPVVVELAQVLAKALIRILIEKILPRLPALIDALFRVALAFTDILVQLLPLLPPLLDLALNALVFLAGNTGTLIPILDLVVFALKAFLEIIKLIINPVKGITDVLTTVGSKFGLFGKSAQDGMGKAVKAVKDGTGTIKSTLAPVGTVGYNAGAAVAQGLINGLKSKKAALEAMARSIAAVVIAAASATLGVRSPSTVFAKIGEQTVAGYIKGLRDNSLDVRDAIKTTLNGGDNVAGQTNIDQSVHFGEGAINMRFAGEASRQTAMAAGFGAGNGIASALARRRNIQVAVRTAR